MAGEIGVDQQWFDALLRYVDDVKADALQSTQQAVDYLHSTVQERARDLPGWSDLADDITVWSEDGLLWIGVNNEMLVSQAFALEYGDAVQPPSALFRSLSDEMGATGQMMRNAHQARYGAF